jgi:hypothetical protein
MSVLDKNVKDKIAYEWNVFTDELDVINRFNENRIVTAERNSAGTINMIYDPASKTHIETGPYVVTDNNGNVVVVGR